MVMDIGLQHNCRRPVIQRSYGLPLQDTQNRHLQMDRTGTQPR